MHILIVARGCPNHEYPMNGIFEFDQAKALASIGHKVSYLSIDTRSLRRKRSLGFRSFSKDGVDVFGIDLPLGRIPLRLERAIGIRASLAIAKKAVEINGAPDLVHGHFATYGVYANELGSFFRIPSIYTEHCSLVLTGDEQYCAISQEACQKADLTIAVSSALSSIVSSYSDTPVEIVWNIADADTFSNVHREHHDGYHFVSVGSLLPGKNHSLTINALSILKRKNGEKASLRRK